MLVKGAPDVRFVTYGLVTKGQEAALVYGKRSMIKNGHNSRSSLCYRRNENAKILVIYYRLRKLYIPFMRIQHAMYADKPLCPS